MLILIVPVINDFCNPEVLELWILWIRRSLPSSPHTSAGFGRSLCRKVKCQKENPGFDSFYTVTTRTRCSWQRRSFRPSPPWTRLPRTSLPTSLRMCPPIPGLPVSPTLVVRSTPPLPLFLQASPLPLPPLLCLPKTWPSTSTHRCRPLRWSRRPISPTPCLPFLYLPWILRCSLNLTKLWGTGTEWEAELSSINWCVIVGWFQWLFCLVFLFTDSNLIMLDLKNILNECTSRMWCEIYECFLKDSWTSVSSLHVLFADHVVRDLFLSFSGLFRTTKN